MLGFFKESSNRFILWSRSPRVGTISVPFIFKTSEVNSYLKLSHVVLGKFRPHGLKMMKTLPAKTATFNCTETTVSLRLNGGADYNLHLRTDGMLNNPALRWWISDVQTDSSHQWVWGYFNVVVSVKDGFTAKLESVTAN